MPTEADAGTRGCDTRDVLQLVVLALLVAVIMGGGMYLSFS